MNLSALINRMIAAGVSPGEAGALAAEIYALGVASATDGRSSNAIRQQRYRDRHAVTKRNGNVTERNDEEALQTVTNRNETITRNANAVLPIDTKIINSKRQNSERASRGSRIDPDWKTSDADRAVARQEGFSDSEIDREALRFRDFWIGKAGAGGVKLDWASTWRNWVRTSADRLGKRPASAETSGEAGSGFYAKFGSEEQDAWDEYGKAKSGRTFPRDSKGGWRHPTQWPPGYNPQPRSEAPPPPGLRTMQ